MDVITYVLAKRYVDSKIGSIEAGSGSSKKQIVDVLPEKGEDNVIYLLPLENGKYAEYIWKDNSFVKLKETDVDSSVSSGYLYNGKFYDDAEHTIESNKSVDNIYVDKHSGKLYYYDPASKTYEEILKEASAENSGIIKMYSEAGNNEDGTMSQKAIVETIDKKVSATINSITILDGGAA